MTADQIEVGDIVGVTFIASEGIWDAEVRYIPQATGDSWILKLQDGNLAYIQMFERMDLIKKGPKL